MDSYVVTILPGGRITIPAAIRKDLDLQPGDTLVYWSDDRDIVLRKADTNDSTSIDAESDDPKAASTPGRDVE